jgi:hypothetical protein
VDFKFIIQSHQDVVLYLKDIISFSALLKLQFTVTSIMHGLSEKRLLSLLVVVLFPCFLSVSKGEAIWLVSVSQDEHWCRQPIVPLVDEVFLIDISYMPVVSHLCSTSVFKYRGIGFIFLKWD